MHTPNRPHIHASTSSRQSLISSPCGRSRFIFLAGFVVLLLPLPLFASGTNEPPKSDRWFFYTNDVNESVPLSIHVVRVERAHHDFEFCTTLGKSNTLGMEVVSEQVKSLPAECGQP